MLFNPLSIMVVIPLEYSQYGLEHVDYDFKLLSDINRTYECSVPVYQMDY